MIDPEQPAISLEQTQSDCVEWMSDYVFGSFYFSQGHSGIQNKLDTFMCARYPEQVEFSRRRRGEVLVRTSVNIKNFISEPANHIQAGLGFRDPEERAVNVRDQVSKRLDSIFIESSGRVPLSPTELVYMMGWRDGQLLFTHYSFGFALPFDGRRSYPGTPRYGRSIILDHLVHGKDAKHEAFRTIFEETRVALSGTQSKMFRARLRRLARRTAQLNGTAPCDIDHLFD